MTYDKQILQILSAAGEQGISVRFLAKHVYNMNCTLFSAPDITEVHNYVQQYLLRNSKSPRSLIERTERWGWYRLNTSGSDDARQLMFDFKQAKSNTGTTEEEDTPARTDMSLNLFGEDF